MQNEVRVTLRMPKWAADYLETKAEENFTSRNAEIVRSIKIRAEKEKSGAKA